MGFHGGGGELEVGSHEGGVGRGGSSPDVASRCEGEGERECGRRKCGQGG